VTFFPGEADEVSPDDAGLGQNGHEGMAQTHAVHLTFRRFAAVLGELQALAVYDIVVYRFLAKQGIELWNVRR
jgi:hypothetical protein